MVSVSRGLGASEALEEYRRLLARDDLVGKPWAAVLRHDGLRRTLLFSRFDMEEQRLLPTDQIDIIVLLERREDADQAVARIVSMRYGQILAGEDAV